MMSAFLQVKWPEPLDNDRAGAGAFDAVRFHASGGSSSIHLVPRTEFRFGSYRLVPGARLLLRNGRPVELGSRAFDLLHLLLTRRGTVVEKDEIVHFVWPSTIVEESNLRFQMAALRKALGEDRGLIKTIPGRGYLFAQDYNPA